MVNMLPSIVDLVL